MRSWHPLAAVCALTVFTWPLVIRPLELLAHPLGEGINHYWMLWRAFQDPPVANWPDGLPIPLMDAINAPLALPGLWVDPVLGFNQVLIANLVLAFVGSWALCRALGAGPDGAFVAGIAGSCSPFFGGLLSFGITESMPLGWIGLHVAALLHWERSGRWYWLVAAGGALLAFVLSGWYHAVFALVVEAVLLMVLRRRLGLLLQGLAAGLLVLPRFFGFLEVRDFWLPRFLVPRGAPLDMRPEWHELPAWGTDLLNLVLPSLGAVEVSKCAYVGLACLGLALAAGGRARRMWYLVLPLWVLALGHWLSIGGHTELLGRSWSLPAGWMVRLVEPLQGLSHWYRAAGPATIFLAAAAGLGAERLGRWTPLAALAVLLDSLVFSQNPWPRATTDATPPRALVEHIDGPFVQLPFDNGRRDFSDDALRRYNLWQPRIGHSEGENYEGPDVLLANGVLGNAQDACGQERSVPWPQPTRKGVALPGQIVLHADLCPAAEPLLTAAFGEPERYQDILIYEL